MSLIIFIRYIEKQRLYSLLSAFSATYYRSISAPSHYSVYPYSRLIVVHNNLWLGISFSTLPRHTPIKSPLDLCLSLSSTPSRLCRILIPFRRSHNGETRR